MKNKIEQVGHRLQYMELLNWGTFNNKIWKITPKCSFTSFYISQRNGFTAIGQFVTFGTVVSFDV